MSRYSLFVPLVLLPCLTPAADAADGTPGNRSGKNAFSIKRFNAKALTGVKVKDLQRLIKKQEDDFKRAASDVTRSVKKRISLEGEAVKLRRATSDKMKAMAGQVRQQQLHRIRQINNVFELRQESERLVQDLTLMDNKLVDSKVQLEKTDEDLKAQEEAARREAELFAREKKLLLMQEKLLSVQIETATKSKAKWFYGFLVTLLAGCAGPDDAEQ